MSSSPPTAAVAVAVAEAATTATAISSSNKKSSNKESSKKSDTMPSRTTREENDVITTPSKPKRSKSASRRAPADPPGFSESAVANEVGTSLITTTTRSAPQRSQSDTLALHSPKKQETTKKKISRAKSTSEKDDKNSSTKPPIDVSKRQSAAPSVSSSSSASPDKPTEKSSNKSSKNKETSTKSSKSKSSKSTTSEPKKGVGRTQSETLAVVTTPKSPVKRSHSSQTSASMLKAPPKSPASILRPASYKINTSSAESNSESKPKSLPDLDSKPAAKTKRDSKSSSSLGKASSKTTKPSSTSSLISSSSSPSKPTSSQRLNIMNELAAQESKAAASSKPTSLQRLNIMEELAAQEAKSYGKTGQDAPARTSASLSSPQGKQAPGAYRVNGQNVARAESGVLSPQLPPSPQKRNSNNDSVSTSTRRKSADERAPPVVKGSVDAPNLIVAAELSDDVESQIEEQVRQRLLKSAVRANIVSVVHGKTLYDPEVEAKRLADLRELHKPRGMKEKLFGDTRNADIDIAASPECILKRTYLKWTVKRNPATNLWVASVQTSQKAIETNDTIEIEKNTLSFPAATQPEAFETGLANATPLLHPLEQHPICHVCKAKFALFRRPVHCRNCGVCVCSACSVTWPSKMLPDTYNTKNSTVAQVCLACDFLARSFRDALVDGDFRTVQHLYATGNVNIRTPFCLDKKAEAMYPVHLAILGGNLKIVKWLCSERFCPLRAQKKRGKKDGPLLTSKNRTPLSIALLHQKLDIVRYLVADMNVSLFEENDMNTNMALANFTSLLKMLPENIFDGKQMITTAVPNMASPPLSPTRWSRSERSSRVTYSSDSLSLVPSSSGDSSRAPRRPSL